MQDGSIVTVKIGHYQELSFELEAEKLAGFIRKIELRQAPPEMGDYKSIWADFHLYPEIAKDYQEGRYPMVSIGPLPGILDSKGNQLEFALDHVALLGASRAALSFLQRQLSSLFHNFKSLYTKISTKFIKEVKQMATVTEGLQELATANASMGEMITTLTEMAASLEGVELPAPEDTNAESRQQQPAQQPAEPKEQQPTFSPKQISEKFNELVRIGALLSDERDKFDDLLDMSKDLNKAFDFFAKNAGTKPMPAKGKEKASDNDESNYAEKSKSMREIMTKMGVSKERMERVLESAKKGA